MLKKWIYAGLAAAVVMIGCVTYAADIDFSSQDTVKQVQQALNDAGFDCGTPDGAAGEKTKNAIIQYRAAKRLSSGNEIDEELMFSLGLLSPDLTEETAKQAAVVAFTNRFATDVFTEDGNRYDKEKFHFYGDTSGYYLNEIDPGTWTDAGDGVMHGDHMKLEVNGLGSTFDVSADVRIDEGKYMVYNITGSAPSYADVSEIEEESDYETFFMVPASLLKTEETGESGEETGGDGVTPELKEFLDSYESFMNGYCEFMETYDGSDLTALVKYGELMSKYADFAEKADDYDEDEMSAEDAKYYVDVLARIQKRLIDASAAME